MTTEIVELSARSLAEAVRRREVSAVEVLEAHLARIEKVNPRVNAIVTLDPDGAMAAARAADTRTLSGDDLGALHGLPIAFKDTHDTAGMRTTSGSPLLADNVPDQDDEVVRRVMAAGAVRMGKTNVPEFAAGSHTFNKVFGTTVNPYDPTRSAGGSSGGAAASLAMRMQPLADGSDMGGSLRNPASFCNVVGLRPTPGRVPSPANDIGFLPLSTSGPMARSVDDVAMLLAVMAGPHRDDPLAKQPDDPLLGSITPRELKGLRVAWAPTLGDRVPVEPAVLDVLEGAVKTLADNGAEVEHACLDLSGADEVFRTLRAAQFEASMGATLEQHPDAFKPDLAWNIREGAKLTGAEVMQAFAEMTRLQRAASSFFDTFDVLVAPAVQLPPFDATLAWPEVVAGVRQETYLDWMAACYLITPLGIPAISVPAGFTPDGLPVGLQIAARADAETHLLGVAAAFEAASGQFALRAPA